MDLPPLWVCGAHSPSLNPPGHPAREASLSRNPSAPGRRPGPNGPATSVRSCPGPMRAPAPGERPGAQAAYLPRVPLPALPIHGAGREQSAKAPASGPPGGPPAPPQAAAGTRARPALATDCQLSAVLPSMGGQQLLPGDPPSPGGVDEAGHNYDRPGVHPGPGAGLATGGTGRGGRARCSGPSPCAEAPY
jgi:hypothetical protein